MNLNHIDIFNSKYSKQVKELYEGAFPKEERYPFWIIKSCAKVDSVEFNCVLDGDTLVGFEYLLKYENTIYIFYLAIDKDKREQGYGTKALNDVLEKYKEEKVILCIDRPEVGVNDIRSRRKDFYLRNGFFETNTYTEDNGVMYEVLCTDAEFKITENVLSNLYKQMSKTLIAGKIIKKMFNVENVHFID